MGELGLTFFDIGALILVLIFSIIGVKQGFIRGFIRLITWLISLIGAKILAYPCTDIVYESLGIRDNLIKNISQVIESVDFTSIESARNTLDSGLSSLSGIGPFIKGYVSDSWNITDILQTGASDIQSQLLNALLEVIEPIFYQIVQIGVSIGLFVLLMIVLSVIFSLFSNILTSVKLIGALDSLLGLILGAIKGIIVVVILYMLIFVILSVSGSESLSLFMNSKFFDVIIGMKNFVP